MKLTLGFSPCPNDTFIFDALVNKKIETDGLAFNLMLEDVQTLNEWALNGKLAISKISYGVLPLILDRYNLMDSGGALGKGVGPLLIAKKQISLEEIKNLRIGIPGENTSAHVLFSLAFPNAKQKQFMIFSDIESAVLSGKVDAGVIIHENRFTYMQKGLVKLIDLGEYWETETGYPIPLGGIVIRKDIDTALQQKIGRLIKESVEFAFGNYPDLPPFVKEHSQEMEEQVMRQHIDLYVNNFSVSLGTSGMEAVKKFIEIYETINPSRVSESLSLVS